jgi:hypothetical protein
MSRNRDFTRIKRYLDRSGGVTEFSAQRTMLLDLIHRREARRLDAKMAIEWRASLPAGSPFFTAANTLIADAARDITALDKLIPAGNYTTTGDFILQRIKAVLSEADWNDLVAHARREHDDQPLFKHMRGMRSADEQTDAPTKEAA